jgi:hypothetical protein
MCNSGYDLGLKSKIWPRRGAVAQNVTAGRTARYLSRKFARRNRKFASSCCKACADYSGYEDRRKRGLIATVPELLLRVLEGVAR